MDKYGKTELLAPAGSLEILKAVARAGADAVYAGGERFGARAYAKNFSQEELREGLDYLHLRGKKLYLTVNTLVKEREKEELWEYLLPLYEAGLDAVIVQDMGVLHFVKGHFPGLAIHASTQMGVTGAYGARMMLEAGCHRIVTARELSLEEISDIYQKTGAEIECFVHGSLCYCYSGQCLMSSMIGGRSGNRGRCAQPCRLPYQVAAKGQGDVQKRKEGYLLSPKDLCGLAWIPELIRSGVHSFKIEGRMKQAEYAAGVTAIYREYIDRYEGDREGRQGGAEGNWEGREERQGGAEGNWEDRGSSQGSGGRNREDRGRGQNGIGKYEDNQKGNDREYQVLEEDYRKLLELGNRSGFTDGYFIRQNGKEMMALESPSHEKGKNKGAKNLLPSKSKKEPLEECISEIEDKEKIKGILRLFRGNPAVLVLKYKESQVEAEGEVVQPSKKQPLSEETVLGKMKKTGNTPFVFEELKVEMEEGVFLTIGALNQLRRKGLELLQEEILRGFRREAPQKGGQKGRPDHAGGRASDVVKAPEAGSRASKAVKVPEAGSRALEAGNTAPEAVKVPGLKLQQLMKKEHILDARGKICPELRVLTETFEQYQVALKQPEVRRVYLEESMISRNRWDGQIIMQAKEAGKECYLALPYIFRKKTAEWFKAHWQEIAKADLDGFLVRNYEELQFLKEQGVEPSVIQGDYQIYACSNEALRGLGELPLEEFTLPVELNFRELLHLDCRYGEMILYGYQPLMVSAQCVHKNTSSCDGKPGVSYLEDRMGNLFPVRNQCQDCYNIIYNISPLSLLHRYQDVCRLGAAGVRLSFTTEGAKEVEQVFGWYRQAVGGGISQEQYQRDFTNGHWKRGVE